MNENPSKFRLAQAVIDSVPANMALIDPDGKIIAVNQAWLNFARQNGLEETETVGVGANYLETCRLAINEQSDFAAQAYSGVQQVVSGAADKYCLEYPCHAPQEKRWFQMHVLAIRKDSEFSVIHELLPSIENNQRGRYALVTHFNVTDLRMTQNELEKLAMISQETDNCVIITDPQGKIEWVNESFSNLTGWQFSEVEGRKPGEFLQGIETDSETISLIREKIKASESFAAEILNYKKDGSPYWTHLQIQPVFDAGGKVEHYFSIQKDISADRQMEIALRESEEQMRLALENTDVGCWDWNPQTNVFKGSPVLFEMVGMDGKSLSVAHEKWRAMKHPDDLERTENLIAEHLAGKSEFLEYQYRVRHADGHWVWVENRARVVKRDEQGCAVRVVGTTRNVTKEYEAQENLRRNNNLLRQMSKMALIGGWELDVAANTLYCSEEVYRIYEIAPETVPTVSMFINQYLPENREFVAQTVEKAINVGESFDFTLPFISGKENFGWVRVIGEAEFENGVCCRLFGSAQDVTEQKYAELTLRERQERFQVLADNAPVIIWQANPQGKCIYVNKYFIELTGLPLNEHLGGGWTNSVHPEDVLHLKEELQRSVRKKQKYTIQYRLRRHDGVYRTVLDNGTPVINEDGELTCFLGSCIDITDRIELEEKLRQSQKMEAMGQLAGGIAHDFNNLLTVILNYSANIERKLQGTEPKLANYAERIRTASERAAGLTNQLLAFSRKQVLQPKALDINVVVKDAVKFVRRLIPENIKIKTILAEGLGLIYVDRTQFEQVIMNLSVNARDAMPGGGTLLFETTVAPAAEVESLKFASENFSYVRLKVSDTGTGMSEETIKRIFEPFFTTKRVGEGTGLGLATVHGIVEQSGGAVTVESTHGHGTSFSVYLPCLTDNCQTEEESFPHYIEQGSETLLVVDDDNEVREMMVQYLMTLGYRVLFARDGSEALRLYGEMSGEIDLLVTDVIMPVLNGVRLGEELRKKNPKLKVLYISGFTDTELNSLNLQESEISFLQKPFTLSELNEIIREIVST